MILREPLTFAVITFLIFGFSGGLFSSFWTSAQVKCHKANSDLQTELRHGPLQHCLGDEHAK